MSDEGRRRWRDAWQLHLPLVIVLAMCTLFTIIEFRRAGEGVGRAWVYTFQWPLIGLFGIVIWNRYRKHGSLSGWFSRHYAERIARFQHEDGEENAAGSTAPGSTAHGNTAHGSTAQAESVEDPQEQAWRGYVASLEDGSSLREAGSPPNDGTRPAPPA